VTDTNAAASAPEAPPLHPTLARLVDLFGDAIVDETTHGQITVRIPAESAREVLKALRDDGTLRFTRLSDVTAVDYLSFDPVTTRRDLGRTPRFDVVYHLSSLARNQRIRVKVALPEDAATIPSAVDLWPAANWAERETYDMFGITFAGHPQMTRILTPEDWQGHPLRKDYPLIEEEIEFTTTQPTLNEPVRGAR